MKNENVLELLNKMNESVLYSKLKLENIRITK